MLIISDNIAETWFFLSMASIMDFSLMGKEKKIETVNFC